MSETWAYQTANTIEITGHLTAKYWPNQLIKITQGAEKFFVILAVSLVGGNTRLTVSGGGVYTLTSGAITAHHMTTNAAPVGLPSGFLEQADSYAAASKDTPADADRISLWDSVANFGRKALTWANLKAALNSIYVIAAGKSGGQTIIGGTGSGESLTLQSTPHATKGKIIVSSKDIMQKTYWSGSYDRDLKIGSLFELEGVSHSNGGSHVAFQWGDGGYGMYGWGLVFGTNAQRLLSMYSDALVVKNSLGLFWRNVGDSANIRVLAVDTSHQLIVGDGALNATYFSVGSVCYFLFNSIYHGCWNQNGLSINLSSNGASCGLELPNAATSGQIKCYDIYAYNNISALSFTDRTDAFVGDALEAIAKIAADEMGNIDHSTLPEFAQATYTDADGKEQAGRDIGNMVSVLTVGIQQLIELNAQKDIVIIGLTTRLEMLEKKVGT